MRLPVHLASASPVEKWRFEIAVSWLLLREVAAPFIACVGAGVGVVRRHIYT